MSLNGQNLDHNSWSPSIASKFMTGAQYEHSERLAQYYAKEFRFDPLAELKRKEMPSPKTPTELVEQEIYFREGLKEFYLARYMQFYGAPGGVAGVEVEPGNDHAHKMALVLVGKRPEAITAMCGCADMPDHTDLIADIDQTEHSIEVLNDLLERMKAMTK